MLNILDEQFDICEGDMNISVAEIEVESGMVVCLDSNSEFTLFRGLETDNDPFGLSADDYDATDYGVKNLPVLAQRKLSVYRGSMWAETDQFDAEQSYAPGTPLYADTASDGISFGQLTTALPLHNQKILGVVISHNPSKGLLECSLTV